MTLLRDWKHGLEQAWESLADGWREVRERTAGALTRFAPSRVVARSTDDAPADDLEPPIGGSWALLAADMYDDDEKIVVRLEAPGLARDDFDIEVREQLLVVRGEKRFQRESNRGRWREIQCAYGAFRRAVPLPVPVRGDKASATYRAGVLRIELPKAEAAKTRRIEVRTA